MTRKHSQSGNMLVYIIGAVFLLGLLLMAMRSGYQPGAGIDAEKEVLQVTHIRKYAAEMERGVQFILANGYSETDIRFAHVSAPGYGTPGDVPQRQVFEPEGGAVEWKPAPVIADITSAPWEILSSAILQVGSTCASNSCQDLVARLKVSKSLCTALNKSIGLTTPTGDPPQASNTPETAVFVGNFSTTTNGLSTTGDYTNGQKEACYEIGPASNSYLYYRVLLAR